MRRLALALAVASTALAAWASDAWASPTFSKLPAEMLEPRYTPATATLPNGTVLLAGGQDKAGKELKTAELFDPATGAFTKIPAELNIAREEAATAALPGGKVLIAGGFNSAEGPLGSAELFNPATSAFEKVSAPMAQERDGPAAAVLADGRVLIVGGAPKGIGNFPKTAEVFDPAKQTFEKVAGEMTAERFEPIAATLPDGTVLIAGGTTSKLEYLKSAELFNPATNTFTAIAGAGHELSEPMREMGAAMLQNGNVLVLGGFNAKSESVRIGALFNSELGAFEPLSTEMAERRSGPGTAVLPDGRVLIAGGWNEAVEFLKTAELTSVSPPAATTTAASGIGTSSSTLNGIVLAETVTSVHFQYGTSTVYASATPLQTVAASLHGRSASAAVSGLAPGTTYHFRIVAENVAGASYGADMTFTTATAPAPPKAPTITRVSQSRSRWRAGGSLAKISRKRSRPPVGTTFSFTLDQPAAVSFAFTQQVSGRKVGRKCVAKTRANRRRRRCLRTVTRGTLSFAGHAGANKIAFQGRITRTKKLKPGTYTLVITARNVAGQRSAPKRLTFTIVR